MPSRKAKEWDEAHGFYYNGFGKGYPEGYVPKNRPCDFCGEVVGEGFIHEECRQKEMDKFLDILY